MSIVSTLDHVEPIAEHVQTFWFRPEKPLDYVAGQFIEMTIHHDNPDERGVRHWFTLSSSPTDELLSITTKLAAKPSSFKQHLFALKPGDGVLISDAMGDFVLPKDKTIPLIFVVGGIGVTPAHSMVKWLVDNNEQRTVHLVYAAHSDSEIAFKPLFDSYVTKADYIVQQPSPEWTGRTGSLTSEDIYQIVQSYQNPLIYLSGPEEMVEVFVADLKEKGVKGSRLVTDYFPGYAGTI